MGVFDFESRTLSSTIAANTQFQKHSEYHHGCNEINQMKDDS